jgi:transcriptional regulator with XRE-family HTH domain
MNDIERDLDRVLTLLRNKIRERGFTQLEVQEALSWGRSYISQLLTKQKSLRVEQVLLILSVIDIGPAEFFAELYHLPINDSKGRYPHGPALPGRTPDEGKAAAESSRSDALPSDFGRSFRELREMVQGLVRLLLDKNLIGVDELTSAVQAAEGGPLLAELASE